MSRFRKLVTRQIDSAKFPHACRKSATDKILYALYSLRLIRLTSGQVYCSKNRIAIGPRPKRSKAGRWGTLVLFFALGLGVLGFVIKTVVIESMEGGF